MKGKNIVIDACVFSALLHKEAYSDAARQTIRQLVEDDYSLIVPDLFLYELLSVAKHKRADVSATLRFFRFFTASSLKVVALSDEIAIEASRISDQGHPKSGFPSIYDSVYHALAILLDTDFITADKKHYLKTQHLGHIRLISAQEVQ